jgi:hypothetical protein
MNLYEISNTYLATAQQLAEIDIDEQTLADTLEAEQWPVEEKARAVSAMILNLEAEASMVKEAGDRIAKRAKSLQARADWLHDYLLVNMQRTGITEIKALDGTFRAKLYPQRDASVEIVEPDMIPADYLREIPVRFEPDKTLIKKAISDGYDVPGARIVKKDRLEIK